MNIPRRVLLFEELETFVRRLVSYEQKLSEIFNNSFSVDFRTEKPNFYKAICLYTIFQLRTYKKFVLYGIKFSTLQRLRFTSLKQFSGNLYISIENCHGLLNKIMFFSISVLDSANKSILSLFIT